MSLSRPACASALSAAPEPRRRGAALAGGCGPRRPLSTSRHLPRPAAPLSSARDVDCSAMLRARCRTPTARCSARRCRGRPRERRAGSRAARRARCEARAGVGDRGEVPSVADERDQKCANSDSGSIVPPDFEETDGTACAAGSMRCLLGRSGSSPRRSSRARAGAARCRVAGRTRGAGTSGASEDPPMPSSTTSSHAVCAETSAAKASMAVVARRASARRSSASRAGWRSPGYRAGPTGSRRRRAGRSATRARRLRAASLLSTCARSGTRDPRLRRSVGCLAHAPIVVRASVARRVKLRSAPRGAPSRAGGPRRGALARGRGAAPWRTVDDRRRAAVAGYELARETPAAHAQAAAAGVVGLELAAAVAAVDQAAATDGSWILPAFWLKHLNTLHVPQLARPARAG